ncbi:MAG TPA: hypothetical protein V6D48_23940 [Oculatellaceae cyanobacterium]
MVRKIIIDAARARSPSVTPTRRSFFTNAALSFRRSLASPCLAIATAAKKARANGTSEAVSSYWFPITPVVKSPSETVSVPIPC